MSRLSKKEINLISGIRSILSQNKLQVSRKELKIIRNRAKIKVAKRKLISRYQGKFSHGGHKNCYAKGLTS